MRLRGGQPLRPAPVRRSKALRGSGGIAFFSGGIPAHSTHHCSAFAAYAVGRAVACAVRNQALPANLGQCATFGAAALALARDGLVKVSGPPRPQFSHSRERDVATTALVSGLTYGCVGRRSQPRVAHHLVLEWVVVGLLYDNQTTCMQWQRVGTTHEGNHSIAALSNNPKVHHKDASRPSPTVDRNSLPGRASTPLRKHRSTLITRHFNAIHPLENPIATSTCALFYHPPCAWYLL
jgi:hypothetical protein